ncbi:NAD(P)-dependent oxidoreductase [Actinacidiphila acidipaludis]|uniref:NAD(P)H-binding protein n=1 Tax=Actinacidiphila acidipaludis TaxID=2873382 RepID=A0ABS7Q4U2_9ACTN|nr:NAD(P)H-binding protein [Streptomyces acidipaludis]MBY8877861.1 NAD(P)H-binding protein [Streptomyces acidipaludis]
MRLTIFAATGGIGTHLLDQALTAGHDVTAVVRDPARLTREVRTVTADLAAPDPAALRVAVDGADAVLSALGPRSRADAGVTAAGTRAIVEAMRATGTRRIVVVSAAPVSTTPSPGRPNPPRRDPGEGPVLRYVGTPLVKRVLSRHYADLAVMEDLLRDSGLEWTSVRPPKLNDKPLSGAYRVAHGQNLRGGVSVSRADVAHFMLRALDESGTVRQAVGIAD